MHHEDEPKQEIRKIQPTQTKDHTALPTKEPLPLSQFLAKLNTRFGTDFNEDGVGDFIRTIEKRLRERKDLKTCVLTMEPDEARPIFAQAVMETMQSVFEQRSAFYTKLIQNEDVLHHLAHKLSQRFQLQNKRQRKNGGHDV